MKIAIIGAGFTGLAAALELQKAGHDVTVFEADSKAGGLASGFHSDNWDWTVEKHYHHIFESDHDIRSFVEELGLCDLLFYTKVSTKTRRNGQQFPLESAATLLTFPQLSIIAKLRTAATLAFLRYTPSWKFLEKFTAEKFLTTTMGSESYEVLWKPLFVGKFGKFASEVNAAWFWARIHVRSQKLGYFKGGFATLVNESVKKLEAKGIQFYFSTPVQQIKSDKKNGKLEILIIRKTGKPFDYSGQAKENGKIVSSSIIDHRSFDEVLVAGPSFILKKIVPELPKQFATEISQLKGVGAQTLVLQLDKPFFADKTYWLNINEKDWPFLAVVEHTNLAGTKNYNGKSIVYIGKYLEATDPQFTLSKDELLQKYHPFLKQLSANYKQSITNSWLFTEPFAQPIPPINHSIHVPETSTPIPNVYWASMQHVYPWDRGTNYAVAIGRQVAATMISE